jgi:hypothetical protein
MPTMNLDLSLPIRLDSDDTLAVLRVIVAASERRKVLRLTIGAIREQRIPDPPQGVPMMLTLTDTQQCSLSIAVTDKKGKAASVDGAPQWSTSDVAVVTVEPAADGLSAVLKAQSPGTAQIAVVADADLGDGITPLSGTLDVTVIAGAAVAVAIGTGTPEEQPEA